MKAWAVEELQYVDLGDVRRNKRLMRIVSDLAAQPNASVPQASGDLAATQAAYKLWKSPYIKPEAIASAHQRRTLERIKQESIVIAIQDTTELNFTHHPAKRGMGYLDNYKTRGLKIHSVFCSTSNGIPLGVLDQQVWARDIAQLGKKHQRHKKPISEKESQRWLTAMDVTQSLIPPAITVVTVADREADIYELFMLPRRPNSEFLIRAMHNRTVKPTDEDQQLERLEQAIGQVQPCGQLTLELRRNPERPARLATLTLRTTTLELQPPATHPERESLQPIRLQVILAEEANPPPGAKPIRWLLLTTLEVTRFEDVVQCLRWYSYRWLIERYHYVLKSGCRIEQLQLETAERIHRALATYTIVAWRLLWITYLARYQPDTPADTVLETHEWQALYCTIHQTPNPPDVAPNLRACVGWIAQLGGFLARKGDGEPGVKTLWRGLRRLHDIAQTWLLVSPKTTHCVKSHYVKKDVTNA
ncbi:MAG: IS4 family transposase [Symploca sp. SIO2E6]|nr:IS4 family transposase [Symploca sp. SIO2E6]